MPAELSANTDSAASPAADEPRRTSSLRESIFAGNRASCCLRRRANVLAVAIPAADPAGTNLESMHMSGWIDESAGLVKQCVGHVIILMV